MENWKDQGVPFEEFTTEITNQWKQRGFSYLQCKEWLGVGFKFADFELVQWLRDSKKVNAEWVLNNGDYETLKKEFLSSRESLEESLITQILTILDDWKDKLNSFYTSEAKEKEDVGQVIKQLASNKGSKLEQYQAIRELLKKYSDFTSVRLENYLSQWNKLLEKGEEETILPPWLFSEEENKTSVNKIVKTPKIPKSSELRKPWECKICEKTKFYSKAEFIRAHGVLHEAPSIWVYTTTQPNKNEPLFISKWLCRICKQENHAINCRYYREIKPIISPPEIFDWESYWKWWFGVYTLDWYEPRFFGRYKEEEELDSDDESDGYETASEDI